MEVLLHSNQGTDAFLKICTKTTSQMNLVVHSRADKILNQFRAERNPNKFLDQAQIRIRGNLYG